LINLVTNGFISAPARKELFKVVDAYRVDLKGIFPQTYQKLAGISSPKIILENIKKAKSQNIWVELVTNLIPGVNDSFDEIKAMARWIKNELGDDVPWHLTRFFPAFRWNYLPATSLEVMERAWEIAKEEGLKFVYLGNVHGHKKENTYCPSCKELLIERRIFGVIKLKIKPDGTCPNCGEKISGHFERAQEEVCYDERVF